MGANSTLLRLLLRMPKSSLLVATYRPVSSCPATSPKLDPRLTGNQNGRRETASTCIKLYKIANEIYVKFQRNQHICFGRTTCPMSGWVRNQRLIPTWILKVWWHRPIRLVDSKTFSTGRSRLEVVVRNGGVSNGQNVLGCWHLQSIDQTACVKPETALEHHFQSADMSQRWNTVESDLADLEQSESVEQVCWRVSVVTRLRWVRLVQSFLTVCRHGGSWLYVAFRSGSQCVGRDVST